jgi:PadR family transcriptional regulator, regulatory protein AphA
MLSIQPMSGYDIRKAIDESVVHFWRESYGQIYPTLKRLALQGLIQPKAGPRNAKTSRQLFALTSKGKARLREWLALAPGTQPPRSELLLKLFFARLAPTGTARGHVLQFRDQQQKALKARRQLLNE